MKFLKLKDLHKSSVYITPNFPVLTTKRYKLSFYRALSYVILYSFFVALTLVAILTFTPAKKVLFFIENEEIRKHTDQIAVLEKQITLLTKDLTSITSTNRKLKYAVFLAEGDSIDSTNTAYDSLRKNQNELNPVKGHVLAGLFNFIERIFISQFEDSGLFFIEPVLGYIVDGFNPDKGHLGIDYAVPRGTPVSAPAPGYVIFSGYTVLDGYTLMLEHKDGYKTVYKHLEQIICHEREYIMQGQLIALSGNSGVNTSGAHLHFEIWKEGKTIDPLRILINQREKEK